VSKKKKKPASAPRAALFGVGLDNQDGHKRITTGEQFAILGGSEETTFEELKSRGKNLHQVEPSELAEILDKSTPR
jgi:hypothetical protein